jgi:transposase
MDCNLTATWSFTWSFIPPPPIRQLRDLTRYRVDLIEDGNRVSNRIQKVLEDANLKISSVATDTLGVFGPYDDRSHR